MAKRKQRITPAAPIRPDIKARFEQLMKPVPKKSVEEIGGFKTKNINNLWRWDTLEDVEQSNF